MSAMMKMSIVFTNVKTQWEATNVLAIKVSN